MNTEEENWYAHKVTSEHFNLSNFDLKRIDEEEWPDFDLEFENTRIALELTEMISKQDANHSAIKKLAQAEIRLERRIANAVKAAGTFGGVCRLDVDLRNRNTVDSNLEILAQEIRVMIGEVKDGERLNREIESCLSDGKLVAKLELEINSNWKDLLVEVSHAGRRLLNIEFDEMQTILNRKSLKNKNTTRYDECWLLIIEHYEVMRGRIPILTEKLRSDYNKVFLFREVQCELVELK